MTDVTVRPGTRISARPATFPEARNLGIRPGSWLVEIERAGETSLHPLDGLVVHTTT